MSRVPDQGGLATAISLPINKSNVVEAEPDLSRLPINRYRFTLAAATTIKLPGYKGSTFHGGFGHALRKISPTYYRLLFEPGSPTSNNAQIPRPYVLIPPLDELRLYQPGHVFALELTLFGNADHHFSICHAAVEYLGNQLGLGEQRGRFEIQKIEHADSSVLAMEPWPTHQPDQTTPFTIHFLTRTRLKVGNQILRRAPDFHDFFSRLLGRLDTLAHFHCHGKLTDQETRSWLLARAEQIQLADAALQYKEWDRFSGRQRKWMKFGGLLGSVIYHGDPGPFLPYLILGEWCHVGGKTSFGLGRFAVEAG